MPFIFRKGRIFLGREGATYGTPATAANALAGIPYGPLSGLATSTLGAQAGVNGLCIPTLTRELESLQLKHQSPSQVGRRYEDLAQVQGRRNAAGQITGEVMPDTFGLLLFLALGADSVVATGTSTIGTGGIAANATSLPMTTGLPALSIGQYLFISDGANSEYVKVASNAAANATPLTITGGAGTGGGVKFAHAAGITVQAGPWTHTFTPSLSSPGTWQAEDNWGGASNSLLYTGMVVDSLELACPIDNDTQALTYTMKVLGKAPAAAGVTASAAPGGIPVEEVPIAAGNAASIAITGGTDASVHFIDYKMTIANTAKAAKDQVSGPDPYAALGTNFSIRGSAETIFEDYGVYQDFMNNKIWSPLLITHTWPQQLMPSGGAGASVAAVLTANIQRFALEKAPKATMKDEFVHLPIENWRAEDYPDITSLATFTLLNNVALY